MVSKMAIKRKKFKQQDYHRYRKLKKGWKRPHGRQSKLRKSKSGNGPKPKIGYGAPKKERGFVNGRKVILVYNVNELKNVQKSEKVGIMISATVGLKKLDTIIKKAEELGLFVLNPKRFKQIKKMTKRTEMKKAEDKKKEKKKKEKEEKQKEEKKETKQLSEKIETVEKSKQEKNPVEIKEEPKKTVEKKEVKK